MTGDAELSDYAPAVLFVIEEGVIHTEQDADLNTLIANLVRAVRDPRIDMRTAPDEVTR